MTQTALPPTDQFLAAAQTVGLDLSAAELTQLGAFLHHLLETNKQFNLTAIRDPEPAWMRHILESLSLLPHLADAKRIIDVGSGGGLPALPLAIACPDRHFTLLEATGKKARFLQSAAASLGLANVVVLNDRAEKIAHHLDHRQQYDLATSRAVGKLNTVLELMLPLVRVQGRALVLKGRAAAEELEQSSDALMALGEGLVEIYEALPGLEDEAVVVEITKTIQTPKAYPRDNNLPKLKPL